MNKIWKTPLIVFVCFFLIGILGINLVSAAQWDINLNKNLVSYWDMDNSTGTLVDNRYGSGYDGTLRNGTDANWIFGKIGNGLNFSNSEETIVDSIGRVTALESANYSISFWFNGTNVGGNQIYFGYDDNKAIGSTDIYMYETGGDTYLYTGGGETTQITTSSWGLKKGEWKFVTFVQNATHMKLYINGALNRTIGSTGKSACAGCVFKMGGGSNAGFYLSGRYDEFSIFNKSLSSSEITTLYNNGNGISYSSKTTDVDLTSPTNNTNSIVQDNTFIVTSFAPTLSLKNITYYVWDMSSITINKTTLAINSSNVSKLNINLHLGNFDWNAQICGENATGTFCHWGDNNFTLDVGAKILTTTNDSWAYETESKTFIARYQIVSGSSIYTAQLIYNGTNYTITDTSLSGTSLNISKIIDIPTINYKTNKNFQFRLVTTKDGYKSINLVSGTQIVNLTYLSFCNATYPTTYLNFTFKDESTSTLINASVDLATFDYWLGSGTITKEYIFQNNTNNFNYAFCFAPADKPITIDLSFKYSKTSYPQRTFVYNNKALTNSSTNQILYLLSSADGIYTTLQFLDAGTNAPISGVEVTAEREISGTWTLVAQGQTDAAGSITFWVNPDFEHRISATKTGYASVSEIITPTQTSYTVFMGTSANVTIPGYRYKNMRYVTYPGAGRLNPNTDYTFGFNVTANDGNIVSCKIEIRNLSSSVVATSSVGCGAYGGNISVTYNVGTNSKLFGYYYVDIGNGLELFKANDAWFVEYQNVTSTGGLIGFFEALGDLPDWGDTHNRQEFSKVVFFFFIMIFMIGIFTFFSGYDLSSPGSALIILWGFIAFGSVSGIIKIEGLSPYVWWNQYGIFIIVSFMLFGFILNTMRREAQ